MFINPGAAIGAANAAQSLEEKVRQLIAIRKLCAEAKNPATDPNRLAAIALQVPSQDRWKTRSWQKVYNTVAENPNTPPYALAERLIDSAPAVARNPVFPLLFLERPDWLNHLSHDHLGALLRLADAPPLAVASLASHPDHGISHEAQHHIAFSGSEAASDWREEMRAYLVDVVTWRERRELQLYIEMVELGLAPRWITGPGPWPEPSPPEPGPLPRPLVFQGSTPEEKAQLSEARSTTSGWVLERLARTTSSAVRTAVLENPAATSRALHRAVTGRKRVAVGIGKLAIFIPWGIVPPIAPRAANHPNADALLLWRIAGCSSASARRCACRHPRALQPLTQWRCRHTLIREVMQVLRLPITVRSIRVTGFLLFSNPRIASRAQLRLAAESGRWTDRIAVALNPRTSLRIVRRLTADGHIWVRAAAHARLNGESNEGLL